MKSAKEMFSELGYEKINEINIVYKGKHFSGRPIHIAFFDNRKILITKSIGLEELQAINKQVEELHWNDITVNIDVKLDGKKVMEAMRGGNNA